VFSVMARKKEFGASVLITDWKTKNNEIVIAHSRYNGLSYPTQNVVFLLSLHGTAAFAKYIQHRM
jgi:hypothetical protein